MNPIWKFRESVASAPTRYALRSVPAFLSVAVRSSAALKIRFGVIQRNPASFRQDEATAAPCKKVMPKSRLESPDL